MTSRENDLLFNIAPNVARNCKQDSDRFLFLALFEMFLQILSDVLGSNSTKKTISCYTFKQFQLGIMNSEQVQINMQQ